MYLTQVSEEFGFHRSLIEQALHGVIEGSDTGDVHPGAIALEVPGNGRK